MEVASGVPSPTSASEGPCEVRKIRMNLKFLIYTTDVPAVLIQRGASENSPVESYEEQCPPLPAAPQGAQPVGVERPALRDPASARPVHDDLPMAHLLAVPDPDDPASFGGYDSTSATS